MSEKKPVLIAGRYAIQRKLGQGGMGIAVLAEDTALKRQVVLKLPNEMNSKEKYVFIASEALVAASLPTHSHIVTVLDFFFDATVPIIVMEYVPGALTARDFAKTHLAKRKDALTRTAVALYVTFCAAKGLQFAHEHGVVHRDMKPGNVLLSQAGVPKLADFGLSKQSGTATREVTGKMGGTVLYKAPEQFSGTPASFATDRYQLGCTLYELLEGQAPHEHSVDEASLMFSKLVLEAPDPAKMKGLNAVERASVLRLYKALMHDEANERAQAHECVECIASILFGKRWKICFSDKRGPIPKSLSDRIQQITRYEPFASKRRLPDGSCAVPVPALVFNDPTEALEEMIALLIAGAGSYVYLASQ